MIKTDISELKDHKPVYGEYAIYSLVNLDNGKRYIGRTKNLSQRIGQHLGTLKSHKHQNPLINADSNCKFGYEILEEGIPYERRKEKEREYIERYKTYQPQYGYNSKDHCVATINNKVIKTKLVEEMVVNIQKIKRLRNEKGLSQAQLANLIGVAHKSSICKMEREMRYCSFATLNKIAKALDCSPLSLIRIDEYEEEVVVEEWV